MWTKRFSGAGVHSTLVAVATSSAFSLAFAPGADAQAPSAKTTFEQIAEAITVSLPQQTATYSFADATTAAANPAPAWTDFQRNHPAWTWMWWNPYANVPHRAMGEAIPIPGVTQVTESNVEDVAWEALDLLGDLTGVPKSTLRRKRLICDA